MSVDSMMLCSTQCLAVPPHFPSASFSLAVSTIELVGDMLAGHEIRALACLASLTCSQVRCTSRLLSLTCRVAGASDAIRQMRQQNKGVGHTADAGLRQSQQAGELCAGQEELAAAAICTGEQARL
jgi:hypothetical protein